MKKNWGQARWIVKKDKNLKESNLLQQLKQSKKIYWLELQLDLKQSVSLTAEWYKYFIMTEKN